MRPDETLPYRRLSPAPDAAAENWSDLLTTLGLPPDASVADVLAAGEDDDPDALFDGIEVLSADVYAMVLP